jgi:hypothetical protein
MGDYMHINTAENFYSILKRGITGVYHQVSEAHLHRYLAEFDFRYNNRSGLGVEDEERTRKAIKGASGTAPRTGILYTANPEASYGSPRVRFIATFGMFTRVLSRRMGTSLDPIWGDGPKT